MRIEINKDLCEKCGICISVCPKSIFFLENEEVRTRNEDTCIYCMACEINCPFHAIRLVRE